MQERLFDFRNLGFFEYCEALTATFVSVFAKDKLLSLAPCAGTASVIDFQTELSEAFELMGKYPVSFQLKNDRDFYDIYHKIIDSAPYTTSPEAADYLVIRDFILMTFALRNAVKTSGKPSEKSYPLLSRRADLIMTDMTLAERIGEVFEKDGSFSDNASAELKTIRRGISAARGEAARLLKSFLNLSSADKFIQEKNLTERGGRYTIPCKTNFSQYIDGIIHDRSASGSTLFIEPVACVKLNNALQENLLAEKRETAKIMAELLKSLTDALPALAKCVEGYSALAFRLEICRFYGDYDWVFPEFNGNLTLKKIHHPLLRINKKECSVPIDISLNDEERLIAVSGPNTGGKTAALKSVGLNHIIGMCGLPVFARKAEMIFFSDIRADIGDRQSLSMDLSTFSAHMSNIKDILKNIGSNPLILFDELGTGTDPKEGAALALAILDYLKKRGVYVMVTTHFSEIKTYALCDTASKLYAVRFDYETFTPKYDLIESVAGFSDPILIAKRLGFPDEIIRTAESNMAAIKTALEFGLEEVSLLKAEAVHKTRELEAKEAALALKDGEIRKRDRELSERLAKREQELLEESYALLARSKRLAEQKLKAAPSEIQTDISKTASKIKTLKEKKKPLENVKAGDTVFLEKFGGTAKILNTAGKNIVADVGGIRVNIALSELFGYKAETPAAVPFKKGSPKDQIIERSSANELVLVGKRVEEALDILDRYIDSAQYADYEKVYVIHGRGSGQLKRGVREFLRTCGRVKGYSPAAAEDGGDAVTIVTL